MVPDSASTKQTAGPANVLASPGHGTHNPGNQPAGDAESYVWIDAEGTPYGVNDKRARTRRRPRREFDTATAGR